MSAFIMLIKTRMIRNYERCSHSDQTVPVVVEDVEGPRDNDRYPTRSERAEVAVRSPYNYCLVAVELLLVTTV